MVAYDITSVRERRAVAALLEGHGVRLQRSVFALDATQYELVGLLRRAEGMISGEHDRLHAYPVNDRARLPAPWQQRQQRAKTPDYWVF